MQIKNLIPFYVVLLIISCKHSTENKIDETRSTEMVDGMALVPGGLLNMGGDNDQASQNEFPKHKVKIDSFLMDVTEVTNSDFSYFVKMTGYKTVAEREISWEELKTQLPIDTPKPPDSILAPGALVFTPTEVPVRLNNPQLWWRWIIGANWKNPHGPESEINNKLDHPVVHIAWEDADNYCKWRGKRLPKEAEWEWAARGGLENKVYPWGDDDVNIGDVKANFYQGLFPYENSLKDGYEGTAPVKSYAPNGYGLYDMSGNVWEWCDDWFNENYYQEKGRGISDTKGPEKSSNPRMPYQQEKVIRGGSFLCNDSYCSGYRNARRMGTTVDTGLNHTGCRCVKDL